MNYKEKITWLKEGLAKHGEEQREDYSVLQRITDNLCGIGERIDARRLELVAYIAEVGTLEEGLDKRAHVAAMAAWEQVTADARKDAIAEITNRLQRDISPVDFPMTPDTEVTDRQGRGLLNQEPVLFPDPIPKNTLERYDEGVFNVELAQLAFTDLNISHERLAVRMGVSATAIRGLLHATTVHTKRPQKELVRRFEVVANLDEGTLVELTHA